MVRTPISENRKIAVIGGTGSLGSAIARRLAKAGCQVIIGSRSADKAAAAAAQMDVEITGLSNIEAAQTGDILFVTVPYASQDATLAEIAPHAVGKIVCDTTVPLAPPRIMRVQMPSEGCAAQRAQNILGSDVAVVSAFHNVAAHKLAAGADIGCDVLVFSDDKAARETIVDLVNKAGLRGVHAGALVNSVAAEALTSILIFINKTYKVDGAGITITGNLVTMEPALTV